MYRFLTYLLTYLAFIMIFEIIQQKVTGKRDQSLPH